jgi:hypothetical protein
MKPSEIILNLHPFSANCAVARRALVGLLEELSRRSLKEPKTGIRYFIDAACRGDVVGDVWCKIVEKAAGSGLPIAGLPIDLIWSVCRRRVLLLFFQFSAQRSTPETLRVIKYPP